MTMKRQVHYVENRGSKSGCGKGCLLIIIYWAVTLSVGKYFSLGDGYVLIIAALFFIVLLILALSGKLSKPLTPRTTKLPLGPGFKRAVKRRKRDFYGGQSGGDGGGCGGGGCGGGG